MSADEMRKRLAEALKQAQAEDRLTWGTDEIAILLLPVAQAIVAKELRAMADIARRVAADGFAPIPGDYARGALRGATAVANGLEGRAEEIAADALLGGLYHLGTERPRGGGGA